MNAPACPTVRQFSLLPRLHPTVGLTLLLTFAPEVVAKSQDLFVATNGNDGWSGALAEPNRAGTDGPFATVRRAVEAVRQWKGRQAGERASSATVHLRGGRYALAEPIVFTPADSGAPGHPIVYQAYDNERPVLSGGRAIHGWRTVTLQGKKLWAADLPEVRQGQWSFHQLWVNGSQRPRARHPNAGYLAVEEVPGVKGDAPWTEGQSAFRFKAGDLKSWPGAANAELRVMNRWVESHLPITGIDDSERMVRFGKRSVFKLDPGDLYYVENALEILDRPGEWCLDTTAGTLYYLAHPGEDLTRAEVIAPALAQVVRFEGQPEKGAFIDYLEFRGITFAHTEWYFPRDFAVGKDRVEIDPAPEPSVGGFAQAAIGVPGAVRAVGLRASRFDRCRIVQVANYGIELGRGCQQNAITRSELAELGAGGVKLGETVIRDNALELARDNEVSDCHIHDGGLIFHSAIGIWIGQSPGSRVLHNHIHDFYYSGLSVGWTWGYSRALATNTLVEFNHVHHIGVKSDGDGPILSDMAGIYTLGLHEGSVIRNNLWHDCAGLRYGGWGIYFDEGTTHIVAENNVVYRTTHGGFHQHYGKENTVRNNVFADARDFQIQRSRAEAHRSFTFERNIVYWHQGKVLEGSLGDTNYLFRANVYCQAAGEPVRFDKWSFDEWKQRGQDAESVLADPQFVDPKRDDYTLSSTSPAIRLGFRPFSLKGVGVRP